MLGMQDCLLYAPQHTTNTCKTWWSFTRAADTATDQPVKFCRPTLHKSAAIGATLAETSKHALHGGRRGIVHMRTRTSKCTGVRVVTCTCSDAAHLLWWSCCRVGRSSSCPTPRSRLNHENTCARGYDLLCQPSCKAPLAGTVAKQAERLMTAKRTGCEVDIWILSVACEWNNTK